jgi:hypothetical protein
MGQHCLPSHIDIQMATQHECKVGEHRQDLTNGKAEHATDGVRYHHNSLHEH